MNFLELVKNRYSVRSYQDRQVESDKLAYVLECVRLAPSAVNFQPWQFKVITEPEALKEIKTAYAREWFQSAPCVIVACADHSKSWHRQADGKDHADIDVAIAVEHLCLAAAEQGLGTCWVCNFDVPRCTEVLHLPEQVTPVVLIPIGYSATEEVPAKKRKRIEEILF